MPKKRPMNQLELNIQNLTRTRGQMLKEKGLDSVERNNRRWVDVMREVALKIWEEAGWVTVDQLRRYADDHKFQPQHQNAWGAIFRGKHWRCTGRTKSTYASNHAREVKVWIYEE